MCWNIANRKGWVTLRVREKELWVEESATPPDHQMLRSASECLLGGSDGYDDDSEGDHSPRASVELVDQLKQWPLPAGRQFSIGKHLGPTFPDKTPVDRGRKNDGQW